MLRLILHGVPSDHHGQSAGRSGLGNAGSLQIMVASILPVSCQYPASILAVHYTATLSQHTASILPHPAYCCQYTATPIIQTVYVLEYE